MTVRNYNNVTTIGQLTGPLNTSATTVTVQDFAQYPTPPFTATIDRNTATEEIVLVTAIAGSALTVTRGYDGSASIAHSAGASFEHTATAIDFTEANGHVNAVTNVHGTTGELVGTEGAQTILDKTFVGNVHMADVTEGDAVVAVIPSGAGTRNLFRGVGVDSADKFVVDPNGNITSAGTPITTAITGATSAATANKIAQRDGNGDAAFRQVTVSQDPSTANALSRKSYVDGAVSAAQSTLNTAIAAKAATTYVDSQDTATLNSAKAYTDGKISAAPSLSTGFYMTSSVSVASGTNTVPTAGSYVQALPGTYFTYSGGTYTCVKSGIYVIQFQTASDHTAAGSVETRIDITSGINDGCSDKRYRGTGTTSAGALNVCLNWVGYIAAGGTFKGFIGHVNSGGNSVTFAYSLMAQFLIG